MHVNASEFSLRPFQFPESHSILAMCHLRDLALFDGSYEPVVPGLDSCVVMRLKAQLNSWQLTASDAMYER